MPISKRAESLLERHSADVCVAIQQEDLEAMNQALSRMEHTVRELLPQEDPAALRTATEEILRRSQRLALANRQSALAAMANLRGGDVYNDESRSSATWGMNG